LYRKRYPASSARIEVIENGYDEEAFVDALGEQSAIGPLNAGILTIVHSGIVYPDERDPAQLFAALRLLLQRGVDARRLRIRFRAAVHEELLHNLARQHEVQPMVEILPSLPYREALTEMLRADGLLLMQAANCNEQVPAKLYEYLRARRPLLALTDEAGDTAKILRHSGVDAIARLDSGPEIANLLSRFIEGDHRGMRAGEQAIALASRAGRTEQLALLLDGVATRRGDSPDGRGVRKLGSTHG
jgi:glycosyltransferase involved in cell wall biosynthesis